MNEFSYARLLVLGAPEVILMVAALVALFADLASAGSVERAHRRLLASAVMVAGCLAALLWTVFQTGAGGALPAGMLVVDPVTVAGKQGLLGLALVLAVVASGTDGTPHVGEYYAVLMLGTVGMMLMISAENLLMVFVALELSSLSLYLLVAFNKDAPRAAEAALKYFLFGGVAAAFALYGFSLLYGVSGSLELRVIAAALARRGPDPLVWVALILTAIGFGFKIAAVPFHFWAPDAYQGAPAASAAWIASGSKVAAFFLMAKVFWLGFAGLEGGAVGPGFAPGWVPLIAAMAVASMVLGNLAAIVQRSVRRLVAYSAIAHAGYALLGVLAGNPGGVASLLFYVLTYGLAALGLFGALGLIEGQRGDVTFDDLNGLSRRSPVIAACVLVFVLSLAGIPPLAGFFGKFYVFVAALKSPGPALGLLWLVALAILMSAVSLYYYLQILKRVYVAPPPEEKEEEEAAAAGLPVPALVGVAAAAVGVLALGCFPHLLLGPLVAAVQALAG